MMISMSLCLSCSRRLRLMTCELQGQACLLTNRDRLWQRQRLPLAASTACFLSRQEWSNQLPGTCLVTSLSLSSLHAVHMHMHQAAAAVRYIPYL